MKYCNSLTTYSRFKTRVVKVGDLTIGGDNPISVQSMTITDTMDTMATVEESIRMIESGCELVRITAPSKKEAENLQNIKDELRKRGYTTPIVADIHYTPNAAEMAARIVEKVRVNPGNYADKKRFETLEYTDESYNAELDRKSYTFGLGVDKGHFMVDFAYVFSEGNDEHFMYSSDLVDAANIITTSHNFLFTLGLRY